MVKKIIREMDMLDKLTTEQRNPETMDLDELSTVEIIKKMNEEDNKDIAAVNKELPAIAKIIDEVTLCLKKGGRLIYIWVPEPVAGSVYWMPLNVRQHLEWILRA